MRYGEWWIMLGKVVVKINLKVEGTKEEDKKNT